MLCIVRLKIVSEHMPGAWLVIAVILACKCRYARQANQLLIAAGLLQVLQAIRASPLTLQSLSRGWPHLDSDQLSLWPEEALDQELLYAQQARLPQQACAKKPGICLHGTSCVRALSTGITVVPGRSHRG